MMTDIINLNTFLIVLKINITCKEDFGFFYKSHFSKPVVYFTFFNIIKFYSKAD